MTQHSRGLIGRSSGLFERITSFLVPPLVAAMVVCGCGPREPHVRWTGSGARRVVPAPSETFGYTSLGAIAYADFFGEIDGLEPGTGATVTFPLSKGLVATAIITVIAVGVAVTLESGGIDLGGSDFSGVDPAVGDPTMWHGGVSDPSRVVISEFSADFTFSGARHRDSLYGGDLDYTAFLLGLRFGGPRRYVPRYYLTTGWGWYGFNYDNRPDAHVTGPYAGGGLELHVDPGLELGDVTLGLDYKVHFYLGDDAAGVPVDGVCGQLGVVLTSYW